MRILAPFLLVVALALLAWASTAFLHLNLLFGVIIPYAAFALFVVGFAIRVMRWGASAVPFRITTTCGQQKSLPWVRQAKLDNPSSYAGVVGRMLLEVLFFRSLFRNSKAEKRGEKLGYGSAKWLWLGALAFHWSMLIIVVRHFRLFLDPVPEFIGVIEGADSVLQIGIPLLYITDVVIVGALTFLFLRRVVLPRIRFVSLSIDYFPLFLLLGIALTGIVLRYGVRVDVTGVKEVAMGLVSFSPVAPEGIEPLLFVHLFLVCALIVYFPWSKLMHAPGVFFSPTRNLANNSRMVRHVNPWNYDVKVHTYAEYEQDFGEKMRKVGLPLDSE
ncbi:sulfate reduction electron transfer complex DsrMKJOP subunit DsrM [Adlercreutzia sp. ZJ242]|uniref:sulfate reduction electron transfer complex DsrMKJOP subunit DsrM n=1 Tax=Adlercreutzia sp. ZJ242 TaxID=2709409 RepID=UPI0013EDE94A|nr:sulfate reduction electron transfer complex DsrMKJOP subunit DsrM [Adlercreutzia sp. ZJ242]